MRRGAEGGGDARCCVKAATRRLLDEQILVVAVLGSGKKSDAMWHVPHLKEHSEIAPKRVVRECIRFYSQK